MAKKPIQDGLNIRMDNLPQIEAAIKQLSRTRVMVGVPEDKTSRQAGKITNAALAYIHDNGAPEANIPARPFMAPGIKRAQPAVSSYLEQTANLALDGKVQQIERAMGAAGQAAVNEIRAVISAGIPPPLSPATVARRRIRSAGSRYRRKATTAAQTTPLVDTGQLRNAITWVLRKVP